MKLADRLDAEAVDQDHVIAGLDRRVVGRRAAGARLRRRQHALKEPSRRDFESVQDLGEVARAPTQPLLDVLLPQVRVLDELTKMLASATRCRPGSVTQTGVLSRQGS